MHVGSSAGVQLGKADMQSMKLPEKATTCRPTQAQSPAATPGACGTRSRLRGQPKRYSGSASLVRLMPAT
jgi:hypothetical protein